MRTTPLIDGHNDLPYLLRVELKNRIYDPEKFNFLEGKFSVLEDVRSCGVLIQGFQAWRVIQI